MKINIYILILIAGIVLSSCFTETVDTFSTINFQLVIPFHSSHKDRAAPDTSPDFTNLSKYKEYKDNVDRIKKAMILQFNYWIDSLVYIDKGGKTVNYNPKDSNMPEIKFNHIRFYLRFADKKQFPVNTDEFDPVNYEYSKTDPTMYLLGEFLNVDVKDYFRQAYHIIDVSDEVARVISDAIKNRPTFFIITEYSPMADQDMQIEPKRYFPYIAARYDLVIKFEISL